MQLKESHKLFYYQLLKENFGVGKQTTLTQVEALFEQQDLRPIDVGAKSVRDILEAMDDCIKMTIFKGGYVYATLMAHESFDAALVALDKAEGEKNADASTNKKPWKRRRGSKLLKPQRPKHVKLPDPEPEPEPEPEPKPKPEPAPAPEDAPTLLDIVEEAISEVEEEEHVELTEELLAHLPHVQKQPARYDDAPALAPEPEDEPVALTLKEILAAAVEEEKSQVTLAPTHPEAEAAQDTTDVPARYSIAADVDAQKPMQQLPATIEHDVHIGEKSYAALVQAFPDINILDLLETSWKAARSTRKLTGSPSQVVFPLVSAAGTVQNAPYVSLRSSYGHPSGKRYQLIYNSSLTSEYTASGFAIPDVLAPNLRNTSGASAWELMCARVEIQDVDAQIQALAPMAGIEDQSYLQDVLATSFAAQDIEGVDKTTEHIFIQLPLTSATQDPIWAELEKSEHTSFTWQLAGFVSDTEADLAAPNTSVMPLNFGDVYAFFAHAAELSCTRYPRDIDEGARALADEIDPARVTEALERWKGHPYEMPAAIFDPHQKALGFLLPTSPAEAAPTSAFVLFCSSGATWATTPASDDELLVTTILPIDTARAAARILNPEHKSWI